MWMKRWPLSQARRFVVGIPIGFPLGGHTTKTKVAEAIEAVARGAQVLDMVINVSRLKSGDHEYVRQDIAEVVKATPGVEHKVILETCYLTQEEKRTACQLVVEAGADYVKTSTGFGAGWRDGRRCEADERGCGRSREGEGFRRN